MSVIEIADLSFRYPGSDEDALSNICLRVEPGEKLGILGPNGGGKSTLLKIILGLFPCQRGTVLIHGQSPEHARRAGLVGYLPQRIEAALDAPISVRQVVELAAMQDISPFARIPPERRQHVDRVFELLGVFDLASRPVRALSGGQLQRIMIARALARKPKLLILDEPTVGIDVRGQQQFATLLSTLHSELGLTTLIVSHELRTVVAGSDRIACLARTMHFHGTASGLTPEILAQVFRHDVEALVPSSGAKVGDTSKPHTHDGGCCAHD